MKKRTLWIVNFGASISLLLLLSGVFINRINVSNSDKDVILVYVVLFLGLYMAVVSYSFVKRIYQWKQKSRRPFYFLSLVTVLISFILFFKLIESGLDFSFWPLVLFTLSGLTITSYTWGLLANE